MCLYINIYIYICTVTGPALWCYIVGGSHLRCVLHPLRWCTNSALVILQFVVLHCIYLLLHLGRCILHWWFVFYPGDFALLMSLWRFYPVFCCIGDLVVRDFTAICCIGDFVVNGICMFVIYLLWVYHSPPWWDRCGHWEFLCDELIKPKVWGEGDTLTVWFWGDLPIKPPYWLKGCWLW